MADAHPNVVHLDEVAYESAARSQSDRGRRRASGIARGPRRPGRVSDFGRAAEHFNASFVDLDGEVVA
jgi:hypothetical protein